jgi:FAD-dependent urate hydroxylase
VAQLGGERVVSAMKWRTEKRVLIVGGGIGGPVLGVWLRRLGMSVEIAEARAEVGVAEGAFLGVAPNGMNVLEQIGLADAVAARGVGCEAFRFHNGAGRIVGSIDRRGDGRAFGRPLTMVRRGELQALLAREAERVGVRFHRGKRLVGIDRSDPAKIVAAFGDGTTASGDLLVGCDGLRSRVRALALPEAAAPRFTGLLDFGGFARYSGGPLRAGCNEMVFGRRAFFGAFATPDGQVWWFHNGPGAPGGSGQELTAPAREHLLALHREDPPWISGVIRATPDVLGPWPIHDLPPLPRWHEGRVCLLGDAAHAMSPSAGQGASLAMEDALALARSLRDHDEPAAAFAAFERLRRPRVDAIFREARRNSSGKAVSGLSAWFRDRLLPLFLKLGAATQTRHYGYRLQWDA